MKFACFTHLPWPEERSPTQIIEETTEQIQYAEELGFHSAWLAEHHFTRYSIGSSSLILATHIAATRTPTTLEFAVSTGHTLCIAVVQDTADALDLCQRFVKLSSEAGFNVPVSRIPFFRYFYVAETEEQARKDAEGRLNWVADIMQWRRFIKEGSEVYQRMSNWRRARPELPAGYDYLYENRAIIGTPDQCAAKIKSLQEYGIEYFGCNFDFGGMERHKSLRSMELFSKEVMPRFN